MLQVRRESEEGKRVSLYTCPKIQADGMIAVWASGSCFLTNDKSEDHPT